MEKPKLRLIKRPKTPDKGLDEDVAEYEWLGRIIAQTTDLQKRVEERILSKMAAGEEKTLKNWRWNNGAPERIVAAKAAGGGK